MYFVDLVGVVVGVGFGGVGEDDSVLLCEVVVFKESLVGAVDDGLVYGVWSGVGECSFFADAFVFFEPLFDGCLLEVFECVLEVGVGLCLLFNKFPEGALSECGFDFVDFLVADVEVVFG